MCDRNHVSDLPAPCLRCGGDGGFEEAGSGKWSVCGNCDGTGEVESEESVGIKDLDDRCGDELPEPLDPMRGVEFPFAENH